MRGMPPIDAAYAQVLHEEGMSHRMVGIELAKHEGRLMPYNANSIGNAIRRFQKSIDNAQPQR